MQETRYISPEGEKRMQEFFEGLSFSQVQEKMDARARELEREVQVVSSRQVELSARQMRKLRKAQRRMAKEKE